MTVLRDDALTFKCEECGARPYDSCRTPIFRFKRPPHASRGGQ